VLGVGAIILVLLFMRRREGYFKYTYPKKPGPLKRPTIRILTFRGPKEIARR